MIAANSSQDFEYGLYDIYTEGLGEINMENNPQDLSRYRSSSNDKKDDHFSISERDLEIIFKESHKRGVLSFDKINSFDDNNSSNKSKIDVALAIDIIHTHRLYSFIHVDISNIPLKFEEFNELLSVVIYIIFVNILYYLYYYYLYLLII